MAAAPSQNGSGPTPMKPHPPSSTPPKTKEASPNAEREKRAAYLRRPEVASVMDDLVSQCLEDMPDDPASFIIQHLEIRTGRMSRAGSVASGASGSFRPAGSTATPAQPSIAPAGPAAAASAAPHGAADELLQWLVDNSHLTASGNAPPLPEAACSHPLASEIHAIQQRLQIDIEATTITSDELDTSLSMTPIQRDALVRSVTRATQALIAVGTNMARVLETMASSLADLAEADRCSVFMADTRRKMLSTVVDGKEISLPFGRGIAGAVAASGKSMRIDKAYEDPRFNPEVDLLVKYVTKSLLTLPMHVNGQLIAVVQLVNKQGGPHFTESDEQIINAFTKVAGVTIRSSMFFKETSRMAQQNETIAKINAELANSDLDEGKLIPIIVRGAKEIVGADRCAFFKVEDRGQTIVAHLEGVYARMKLSTQDGIVGWVARNRELVNITDAYRDERFNGEVDRASGYKTESLLCVPIFAARELVGIAQLVNKKDPTTGDTVAFDEHDEATITAFGKAAGVCMRNCKLHDDLVMQQARLEDVARIATHLSSSDSDFMKPKPILEFIAKVVRNSADSGRCLFYQVGEQDVTPGLQLIASSDISAGNESVVSEEESEGQSMGGPSASSGRQSPAHGIVHPIGAGVIGSHATRSRSSLITGGDLADLEMDAHYPDGSRPDSVVVVPIIDSGMTIGCCVLVDPCAAVANSIVAAGTVKRRSTMAVWKDLSSTGAERNVAAGVEGSRFAADISVGVSMAGFTMRMAHILEMSSRHGNNLAAIMEFEQAGVEPTDATTSTEDFTMATSVRTFAAVDEAELEEIAKLSFDIHKYRRGDAPAARLLAYVRLMMVSLDVMGPCAISDARLHRFLSAIRSKYRNVPYHNFFHAFDVTQTVFTLMRTAGLDQVLEADERFALLTACVCHDVDHMGLNNAFHLRAETPLGILTSVSGQKSVLEVHHCQIAMDLLTRTRLLAETPKDMRVRIQKIIINCILATDMAVHRDKTSEVEAELGGGKFDKSNEQHRQLVMMLLLKMADISNVVKSFDISRQWGIAVTEEFYQQGDRERRAGLEVTPMFDRERKVELAKGQIGFIKMLAVPFFTVAADAFPAFKPLVESAEANIGHWEKVLESTRDA